MWHTQAVEDIIRDFKTDSQTGLLQTKALELCSVCGANELPRGKKTRWWLFLFRQFRSPLVYILLIGAAMTLYLGEWIDMSVILMAVFVNVSVGFWQEFRSSNILETLRSVVQATALVIRDGSPKEIEATLVVPGDIILLQAGKKVPADARIFEARHLEINEALLTGESVPIKKKPERIEGADVAIGDRFNMVHMGTIVEGGEGKAVVVATGVKTEIGKIALLTSEAEEEPTPLQVRIGRLGTILAFIIGAASVLIFVIGVFEKHSFAEMFTTAIAVAVAAIPEGLPAAISIVLAVSAQRILKKKGVVKRLLAAETLGSASVICTDKTGTLTEGKMKVEQVITYGDKTHALEILALANEALIERAKEGLVIRGETTDKAKLEAFLGAGEDFDSLLSKFPRITLLPFDSVRKYIASLHSVIADGHGSVDSRILYVSGAPETLIDLSRNIVEGEGSAELPEERRKELKDTWEKLAGEGYRMIAMAERRFDSEVKSGSAGVGMTPDLQDESTRDKYVRDLTFVGFAAIRDPIREDVKESIREARGAGVRPVMLTGDHILTACSIGKELGFRTDPEFVIEGSEIGSISDSELERRLRVVEIFARVNPEHKMRVVNILQKHGEVVAMTGDGVNDAPALKASDIGVALDSGTDVAKEASDLILLNDSFTIIVSAIKQGRIAFDNIRKVTVFLLVQSFSELILILAALIFRVPLPLTAVQILWTNLVEDSFPNIALSFEPGEKEVMQRKPLKKNEPILDAESKIIVFAIGFITDVLLLGLFFFLYYYSSLSIDHIRTFIFAAVGLDSFFYIYSIKSLRKPLFSYNLFDNPYLLGATIIGVGAMFAAIYVPFLNSTLETVPLSLFDWVPVLCLGILKIIGVEVVKLWFSRDDRNGVPRGSSVAVS